MQKFKFYVPLVALVFVSLSLACGSSSPTPQLDNTQPATPANSSGDSTAQSCTYPLVVLQTGSDTSCSGGQLHYWPIGMAPQDCHGWQATDKQGKLHNNSANNISCNADGSFSFTQFAGNLSCEGNGVTKTYILNACTQDIPPRLYTIATNLSCCSDPNSAECKTGMPSTGQGATIFLNQQECLR